MRAEEHLVGVLDLLQRAIRVSGATQIEIDEAIGRRRGYLSHVFQRRVELKLVDLLRVLEVLGVEPAQLFAAVEGSAQELKDDDRAKNAESPAGDRGTKEGTQRSVLASSDEALERIVRQIIDRILDGAE